jgi:7-cyano-7-deazaguanine synthase in queuosine biosynthesis
MNKRKTIQGEDIIAAMKKLDFERYGDFAERYFNKYKTTLKQHEQRTKPS